MTKPILELKDVKTTVKTADGEIVPILKGIDLKIKAGDFITIIGTNGAGKSTLLNTIAGSLRPDSGFLLHNGLLSAAILKPTPGRFFMPALILPKQPKNSALLF